MRQHVFFYLVILLFGFATVSVQAQVSMNILDWSGENRSVRVASIDKITFTEDDLVLNYNNSNAESLDMLSIRKITFRGSPLGIADVIGTEDKIAVSFHSGNQLLINNLPDGKHHLAVYSIAGILVHRSVVDSGSPAVHVNCIGKGVYIAFINNQAVKFVML